MAKDSLDRFIRSATYVPDRIFTPSSLLSVNWAIDNPKGFQSGKLGDIVGAPSTGKSTLALDLIANAQKLELPCAYADVERSFDQNYARSVGVDLDKLSMIYADTAEHNLETAEMLARRGYKLIVIDSVPALVPEIINENAPEEKDIDLDYSKPEKIAALGTLLSRWTKRMIPIADYHNTLIILINQYRANFSTLSRQTKSPYGPWQYWHNLTWRVELSRVENENNKTTVELKVTKNRLGKERNITRYEILYGQGLNIKADLLKHALERGIVMQKGAWYEYNGIRAQGEKNALELFDYSDIRDKLSNQS